MGSVTTLRRCAICFSSMPFHLLGLWHETSFCLRILAFCGRRAFRAAKYSAFAAARNSTAGAAAEYSAIATAGRRRASHETERHAPTRCSDCRRGAEAIEWENPEEPRSHHLNRS